MIRYFRLHLGNEAPAIGSGVRNVLAYQGRKWVTLVTPTLTIARLPLSTWRILRPTEIPLTPDRRRRLRRTMRKWHRYRRVTTIIKRAEKALACADQPPPPLS